MTLTGHAIEARVNAEDAQFFPSAGPVVLAPYPSGVRVDAAVETGSVVGTDYDSMIAKVIAHGPDRATALARLDRALADTAILGLDDQRRLPALAARPRRRPRGGDGHGPDRPAGRRPTPPLTDEEVARAAAVAGARRAASRDDPFDRRDGWRLGGVRAPSYWKLAVNGGEPIDVVLGLDERRLGAGASPTRDGWLAHRRAGRGT